MTVSAGLLTIAAAVPPSIPPTKVTNNESFKSSLAAGKASRSRSVERSKTKNFALAYLKAESEVSQYWLGLGQQHLRNVLNQENWDSVKQTSRTFFAPHASKRFDGIFSEVGFGDGANTDSFEGTR